MIEQKTWFIEERAVAFASLMLTAREGVAVRAHTEAEMAIDLLVEVLKKGQSTLRFFGVQLIASIEVPDRIEADERLLVQSRNEAFEATFPICVFAIGVRKPEGLYRWLVEPIITDDGPSLLRDGVSDWQVLDEEGAARMIDRVNGWYDAVQGGSTRKTPGRQGKKGTRERTAKPGGSD